MAFSNLFRKINESLEAQGGIDAALKAKSGAFARREFIKQASQGGEDRANFVKSVQVDPQKEGAGIGKFFQSVGKGIVSGVTKASSTGEELLRAGTKAILPESLEPDFPEKTSGQVVEEANPEIFQAGESNVEKAGYAVGEVGAALFGGNKFSAPVRAAVESRLAAKTAQSLGGKTLVNLIASVPETIGMTAAGGELPTKGEVGLGLLLDGIAAPISKGVGKIGDWSFSRLIPTTPTQKGKDLVKGLDMGEAVSSTGITYSKKSLMSKLQKQISELGRQLDDKLEEAMQSEIKSSGATKTYKIEDITDKVKNSLLTDRGLIKKMQLTPIEISGATKTVDEVTDAYNELFSGKEMNVKDLQALKVTIQQGLKNYFDKAVDAKLAIKDTTEDSIRAKIKDIIADAVPETEAINKRLAPLFEATGRLKKKGGYSGYLTDLLAGGFFAGGGQESFFNDPTGFMKDFFTGVVLKRAGTSTLSKSLTGKVLKDVSTLMDNPDVLKAIGFELLDKTKLQDEETQALSREQEIQALIESSQ